MNEHTIAALADDEFEDELKMNLVPQSESGNWPLFVTPVNVRRTQRILEEMQVKAETQIAKHGEADAVWFRRVSNFLRLVTMRLKQANRVIHNLDGANAERERKLRAFAHELCVALDGSDKEFMLDEIFFPFGGMSAGAWLDRRIEKREEEARAAQEAGNVISIEQALVALEMERAA